MPRPPKEPPPPLPQPGSHRAPRAADEVTEAFLRFQQDGHPEDIGFVFDRTAAELLKVAHYLAPRIDQAEDLVQAVYLIAIQRRDAYKREASVTAWLLGI